MVYFSSVALSCQWILSGPVMSSNSYWFWSLVVMLPCGEGKQFTLLPKFTIAGLSCHLCFQFALTKWYWKGRWMRQCNSCWCVHSKGNMWVSWVWVNSHLWGSDLRLWTSLALKNPCRAMKLHVHWNNDLNFAISTLSASASAQWSALR